MVRSGWNGRAIRAGLVLWVGVAVASGCGDGETTDPNGATGGVGGATSGTGGRGTAGAGEGGIGATDASGSGGAGDSGGPGAGRVGAGTAGSGGGLPTAGSVGLGGAGQGGTSVTTPPEPPSCDAPTGKLPKLKLTGFADVPDPVQAVAPPGDPRMFVVSRGGWIYVVENGTVQSEPFLALEVDSHYSELGLLGLAFHPDYAENGLFYVHHIAPRVDDQDTGDLLVEEYERDPLAPNRALPKPRRELLRIPQPTHKHKAGTMAFDSEGLLYIAIGNGGEQPASHDTTLLRGKVLRIAPSPESDTYTIPRTNPLKDGWAPEILESGLRNPWRIALDACTDDLYIADVGNGTNEEVNVVRAGDHGNDFGFKAYEGSTRLCNSCEVSGDEVMPTVEYPHDQGCAIIGGVVYRGHAIPALRGMYLYSDLCTGAFHAFRFDGSKATDQLDLTKDLNPNAIDKISSFGTDASGEVYVMSLSKHRVYRIDPE